MLLVLCNCCRAAAAWLRCLLLQRLQRQHLLLLRLGIVLVHPG
jgi:hypothetical protein